MSACFMVRRLGVAMKRAIGIEKKRALRFSAAENVHIIALLKNLKVYSPLRERFPAW